MNDKIDATLIKIQNTIDKMIVLQEERTKMHEEMFDNLDKIDAHIKEMK